MLDEMTFTVDDNKISGDVESGKAFSPSTTFPPDFKEMFPNSYFQVIIQSAIL
jgi:hypothetical protein